MSFRVWYIAVPVVVGAAIAALALGPLAAFKDSQTSDFYKIIEADPSWLGYLPPDSDDIELVGLTGDNATGSWFLEVDLLVHSQESITSLCFAASRQTLDAACPGSRFLGHLARDVEFPFVSQVGGDSVNWPKRFGTHVPSLDEVDYLD